MSKNKIQYKNKRMKLEKRGKKIKHYLQMFVLSLVAVSESQERSGKLKELVKGRVVVGQ